MLISIAFMIITILIFVFYKKLRNVYGKSLICYLFGMIIAYSLFVISNYWINISTKNIICIVFGYIIHLSLCSSFIWINVISFYVYSCLSQYRSNNGNERFYLHLKIVYGLTAIHFIIILCLHLLLPLDSNFNPGFGKNACYLQRKYFHLIFFFLYNKILVFHFVETNRAKMYLFYIPLSISMIINVICFILSSICILKTAKIKKHNRKMGIWQAK